MRCNTVILGPSRRGTVTIVAAIILLSLISLIAMGVDIGYMASVRNELQNAADSASLAAAQQLMSRELLQGANSQPTGLAAARTKAVEFAALNTGGGAPLTLDRNDANLPDGDVVLGLLQDPADASESLSFGTEPYNSVQIRMHRDDTRNGPLGLFFGKIMGQDEKEMQIMSTATAQGYIKGFKIRTSGPSTSKLLPFALDINVWTDKIINGNGTDNWNYNPSTNAYSAGSDGIKEIKLYPNNGISPGNFGTIDIGSASNSSSDVARQILYGPNASDLAYYANGEFALNSQGFLMTTGDTGISAGFKDELASIRGQPRIIPLYEPPVTGNGDNATFKIVAFVGIVITDVQLGGSQDSKQITIQPEHVIDSTAMGGGTSTSSYYVYKGISITR